MKIKLADSIAPAAVLCCVAFVSACGGKVPAQSGAQSATELIPPPTVQQMASKLDWATDQSVPNTEKQDLVQGSVADPELVDHVLKAYRQEGATIKVVSVVPVDATHITVNADLTLWDAIHPQVVPFVLEEGEWKIEKNYACGIVELMQLSSSAC